MEVNQLQSIIRGMEEKDRNQVLEMMRVFYASPAILSNGSEEIFEADVNTCISDSHSLHQPYVLCMCSVVQSCPTL